MKTPDQRWADDSIQFPRLLAEIRANWSPSSEEWADLCESMDLEVERVDELFDRAGDAWELIKRDMFFEEQP